MAFVAERLGVGIVSVPEMAREISLLHDAHSVERLAEVIRSERPHILHTHTAKAGAIARLAALLAGDARPPVVLHMLHGHAQGLLRPEQDGVLQAGRAHSPGSTSSSPSAPRCADELVEQVAPREEFAVIRLGIPLEERLGDLTADLDYRALCGIPRNASWSAGSGG